MTVEKIEVQGITKNIKGRTIVSNVSLNIKAGEIIGLLGPNGAGKTTCFYMLLGLVSIDSGNIKLDNIDVTHYPIHKRAALGLGYLAQEPSVFRKLSVEDNIMAILETRKSLNKQQRQKKLEELLEEFNLNHIRNSKGSSLSGGERRRVEIARTLTTEPKFILLDEPFAGVDPISVADIQKIIRYLAEKGIGIIITDHNVRETLEICERVYIMNNAKLICEGSPEKVIQHPKVKDVYLGDQFQIRSSFSAV